jgi:hypothetical protein
MIVVVLYVSRLERIIEQLYKVDSASRRTSARPLPARGSHGTVNHMGVGRMTFQVFS